MLYDPSIHGEIKSKIHQALEPRFITDTGDVVYLFDVIKHFEANTGATQDTELRDDIGDTEEDLITYYNSL